ncbi:hypothetical protein ABB55_27235 [Prosthecomicrobium hirschii]|uniref:Uncharacterized protein n=1 Tax=Prosthecodimorpha hirschii TaxID=665126 RepID=A0A0P6WA70_9HYPH|nr:AAA family ATPase [Prosthecomicrobium hirschii]KPL55474.1 hypothetical protein ABB55_27235 [Prosthecomicrobium hirschii]
MLREGTYDVIPIRPNEGSTGKMKPRKKFARRRTGLIMATDFPEIKWAIPGYLPEGLSILAGRQKLGKSWLCIDFAIAVATGGVAMGEVSSEQGDVLYVDLENGERRIQRRIATLFPDERTRPNLDRLEWVTESPALNDGFLDCLEDWRTSVLKPKLVVVDVLQRIKPAGNAARNSYENDYTIIAPLQQWATKHGVAVVLITHTRKGGADDPLEAVTGSNGLSACADATLVLDRKASGATLYVRGRDVPEIDVAMRFDAGRWYLMGDAAEVHRSDERAVILSMLKDAEDAMTPNEVADNAGLVRNNVKQLLFKMSKGGEVLKGSRRGSYIHPGRKDLYPTTDNRDNPITERSAGPGWSDNDGAGVF